MLERFFIFSTAYRIAASNFYVIRFLKNLLMQDLFLNPCYEHSVLFISRMSDDHIRMDVMNSAVICLFTFKGQSKAIAIQLQP